MTFPQYISVDREAIWAALFSHLKAALNAPAWAPQTNYSVGDVRVDPQGHLQAVTVAGKSGDGPTWNDSGGTTSDGSVTWQDRGQGVCTIGRKHVAPPELTFPDQPALFVVAVKERHVPKPAGLPNKLVLRGYLILYAPAPVVNEDIGGETVLAETTLNRLFQAIDAALLPDNATTGKFTLGGQVEHCWVEDDTSLDPGMFTDQAAAIIPLNILVP